MPLIQGKSKSSFGKNVSAEMHAGKPQKQALAIAYNVMRKNRAKKMAEGGLIDDEDMARGKDEAVLHDGQTSQDNEDLHPEMDVGSRSWPAQGPIDDKDHPRRPQDHYEPDAEDLPAHMMAHGGMSSPHKIAHIIIAKRLAKGGSCYEDGGVVEPDDATKKFTKGFKSVFADGGMVDDMGEDEGMDNDSEAESLPFEDEDDVHIPHLGYDSPREDTEGMHDRKNRRGMISSIMKGLHAAHYGRK